jgi:hypothetical protein
MSNLQLDLSGLTPQQISQVQTFVTLIGIQELMSLFPTLKLIKTKGAIAHI